MVDLLNHQDELFSGVSWHNLLELQEPETHVMFGRALYTRTYSFFPLLVFRVCVCK